MKTLTYLYKSPGNKPFKFIVEPLQDKFQIHAGVRLVGIIEKVGSDWVQIGGRMMLDKMLKEIGDLIDREMLAK
ncbi:MAG: hypothetical protein EOP48_28235 [Sphingobacteriales bacterium]|nr:MAG: hypothetical protein EOP48_28235 [Sphingobacteriales bacterium]